MASLNALAAAIRERLLEEEPAPLPGFGTLRRVRVPARVESRADGSRTLQPPRETLRLVLGQEIDSDPLALALARHLGLPVSQGRGALRQSVEQLEALVAIKGEVPLEGVGIVRRTDRGLLFGADPGLLATINASYEGLTAVGTTPEAPVPLPTADDTPEASTSEDVAVPQEAEEADLHAHVSPAEPTPETPPLAQDESPAIPNPLAPDPEQPGDQPLAEEASLWTMEEPREAEPEPAPEADDVEEDDPTFEEPLAPAATPEASPAPLFSSASASETLGEPSDEANDPAQEDDSTIEDGLSPEDEPRREALSPQEDEPEAVVANIDDFFFSVDPARPDESKATTEREDADAAVDDLLAGIWTAGTPHPSDLGLNSPHHSEADLIEDAEYDIVEATPSPASHEGDEIAASASPLAEEQEEAIEFESAGVGGPVQEARRPDGLPRMPDGWSPTMSPQAPEEEPPTSKSGLVWGLAALVVLLAAATFFLWPRSTSSPEVREASGVTPQTEDASGGMEEAVADRDAQDPNLQTAWAHSQPGLRRTAKQTSPLRLKTAPPLRARAGPSPPPCQPQEALPQRQGKHHKRVPREPHARQVRPEHVPRS